MTAADDRTHRELAEDRGVVEVDRLHPEMTSDRPRAIIIMPSVAIKGGIFIREMIEAVDQARQRAGQQADNDADPDRQPQ